MKKMTFSQLKEWLGLWGTILMFLSLATADSERITTPVILMGISLGMLYLSIAIVVPEDEKKQGKERRAYEGRK